MLSNLGDLTEVRNVPLHATGMSDLERCPRYFLFRHRAGLVPRGRRSPALDRGTMLHLIVAELLRGGSQAEAEGRARDVMDASTKTVSDTVGPNGYLPNGQTAEEAIKAIESNGLVAIAMARAFARFFQVGHGSISGLSVRPGAVELLLENGGMAGTLDAIGLDEARGEYWIVDHKTTGISPEIYTRTLPLTAQTLMYPELLRAAGRVIDHPVAGICYNIIRTPTIRCSREDSYDLGQYAARVERWYEDAPNMCLRTFIRPSLELVKLSKPRLDNALDACVRLPVLENFPATGGSACTAYRSVCPFTNLCTRDTALWPEQLERYDRDWRDDTNETGD